MPNGIQTMLRTCLVPDDEVKESKCKEIETTQGKEDSESSGNEGMPTESDARKWQQGKQHAERGFPLGKKTTSSGHEHVSKGRSRSMPLTPGKSETLRISWIGMTLSDSSYDPKA
ncbi:OLC1v1005752C1 [Oldenlandia corymbosa var. corymbosa]|uniref:OLC1v1005752C1 n=1 Tax=Oldenlandia corymbosa var. corymbosa TaxID=529605 RepID=A0AAV1DFE4_OLDCO|nr:OLC1v1005752C1 [Oldenlandia corymbosa var. corymbosa]